MKCENCKDEIVSCEICSGYFHTSEQIKCYTFKVAFLDGWKRMHLHYDCGTQIVFSKVIE